MYIPLRNEGIEKLHELGRVEESERDTITLCVKLDTHKQEQTKLMNYL